MSETNRKRLETAAIIVGYAMSRLDGRYLDSQKVRTWKAALEQGAKALGVPAASLKNLRDEFDPFHDNERKGWWQRALRPNRQRVMGDLSGMSDDALLECVNRILGQDDAATKDLVDSLVEARPPAHNVAERLFTGRRAETLFLENCESWVGIPRSKMIDRRDSAMGFDFAVSGFPERAIEIKGLRGHSGAIQFTDCEWSQAKTRQEDYWLVVVGNVTAVPIFGVWKDPQRLLRAQCRYQRSVAALWTSRITLQM